MAKRKTTRRGNNEGSIFQRKDGRWLGEITIGYKTISTEKFETLFMEWLLVFKRNTVLPRTLERIISNAKTNVLPEIGHLTLSEFSPQIIQKLINKLYIKELSLDV